MKVRITVTSKAGKQVASMVFDESTLLANATSGLRIFLDAGHSITLTREAE